jgi:hypothetical protein
MVYTYTLFSRRRLGVHAPSTDLRLARLGARLARLGVQPPHLARLPSYRLENRVHIWMYKFTRISIFLHY